MGASNSTRNAGFALVTSLMVMLVIGALAAGAVFLSNTNLRIAENTRANAMARYNAEGGMDESYVVLAAYVLNQGSMTLPSNQAEFEAELANWDLGSGWTVAGYERYAGTGLNGADQARVRIRGTAPRNASHLVEALVEAVITPASTATGYTLFGEGFVSLQDIDIAGNGIFDIPFWAGGNIDLRAATVVPGNSMVASGGSCRWGAPPRSCNTTGDPPDVPAPEFDVLRQAVIDAQDPAAVTACLAAPRGSGTIIQSDGPLVCLADYASVTVSGNVQGLVVIGNETTTVALDARTGDPTDDSVPGIVVVSGTVNFGNNASFYGENTIVAVNDIEFGKNVVSHDDTARTFIVTEGDFTLRGTGATNIYASFWVGGTFNWNGTPDNFRGTIVAVGDITGNGCGNCTIRPPRELENTFIPVDPNDDAAGWGIWVLARR